MSDHLLILPHLRVQNANAISSPLTWGFPAMTAFIGLMHALERRLHDANLDLRLHAIGVVSHSATPQTSRSNYGIHSFLLTRNPLKGDGKTAAIVEEGRIHLELSLVLRVSGSACQGTDTERQQVADQVDYMLHTLRIAGGSVLERTRTLPKRQRVPTLEPLETDRDTELHHRQLRMLRRKVLPGFTLVLRDDIVSEHQQQMAATYPHATALDAWLDLTRRNYRYVEEAPEKKRWQHVRKRLGWLVPIPVGYNALSDAIPASEILNARDPHTPLRFVEPLMSIGEWRSPHRIKQVDDMLWRVRPAVDERLFLLEMCTATHASNDDLPDFEDDTY